MIKNNSNIIIEEQDVNFLFKKNKSQLNIRFNRIAFIFFIFFNFINFFNTFSSSRFKKIS